MPTAVGPGAGGSVPAEAWRNYRRLRVGYGDWDAELKMRVPTTRIQTNSIPKKILS